MNFYEVIFIREEEKVRFLVKASTTILAEKAVKRRVDDLIEIVSVKLTKYDESIKVKE